MTPAPGDRTARLRAALAEAGYDGYLTQHGADIFHLTGSTGFPAVAYVPAAGRPEPCRLVVPLADRALAVAPSDYELLSQGMAETWEAVAGPGLRAAAPGRLTGRGLGAGLARLVAEVAGAADDGAFLERLRRGLGRDAAERQGLERARRIAEAGVRALWAEVRPGVRECDLAAIAEGAMRQAGADPIHTTRLGTGPRSAGANANPSLRMLQAGDMGFVDLHPEWEGYGGDITRPFQLGEQSAEQWRITDVLRRVQEAAIALLRPGLTGAEVYERVCALFAEEGLAQCFTHHVGHPLGGMSHPQLRPGEGDALVVGDIVTVEPGLYVPGIGGIRIEDNVEVTAGDPVVLTSDLPKWLQVPA